MSQDAELDALETEEEVDETPFVEFDISVSPSDPTLELLASQVARGDIIIPFYQRLFVWKIEQASKLIESFLMGLPVPQVFLYVNDEGPTLRMRWDCRSRPRTSLSISWTEGA